MSRKTALYGIGVLAIVGILYGGCGRIPRPSEELSWPPAPASPRITYLQSIYGSESISRGTWGKIKDFLFGKGEGIQIEKPYGVRFDGASKLYIADTGRKQILVLDLKSGRASTFHSLGVHGDLLEPVYVLLDSTGNVYVSDTQLRRIAVFDQYHEFSHFIGNEEQLAGPVGMAFSRDGTRLYVVDTQNHDVKMYGLDGTLLGTIGQRGDDEGEFHYPLTVAVSESDTVYIVDSFHFAVQAFDPDGRFLFSFGPAQHTMGAMARPRDIAIDSDGHVYVTDALRNNVQVYNATGELLIRFGTTGLNAGQFRLPAGIAIDSENNIYVADSINRRIQVFRYVSES
jgi:DNA-binding beta-propeller fold protein YncE